MKQLTKWTGSKRRLVPHFVPLLPTGYDAYVEPFLGGGAMFAGLSGHLAQAREIILGDLNAEVMNLYGQISRMPDMVIDLSLALEAKWLETPPGEERKRLYYNLRKEYWHLSSHETPYAAALLLFLLKHCFNGLWRLRRGGGRFSTPCGETNQQRPLIDPFQIRRWHDALARGNTRLHAGPYSEIHIPVRAFIYCDPPYRNSHTYSLPFNDTAQIHLLEWCRRQHLENHCTVWLSNQSLGDGFFARHAPEASRKEFPLSHLLGRGRGAKKNKVAKEILLIWD